MKEIGGYFELENFTGSEYHEGLLRLNLGRTALQFMLQQMHITTLWLPSFMCASVFEGCEDAGVRMEFYGITEDFLPDLDRKMNRGECLYLMNYYGQLTEAQILSFKEKYGTIILDNTHAFFQKAIPGIPALWSVRKYFGVTDGAYADLPGNPCAAQALSALPADSSHTRFSHILGRYEEDASSHYQQMLDNAHSYDHAPVRRMSALTQNLLKGIDYGYAKKQREHNYDILASALDSLNPLPLHRPEGPFVYPFLCKDGPALRKQLAREKIFVPTYWSNVIQSTPADSIEHAYAADILALPCDQRYDESDMQRICSILLPLLQEA